MYVVLSQGSTAAQSLLSIRGVQEVTATNDGERVFIIRKDLKKD